VPKETLLPVHEGFPRSYFDRIFLERENVVGAPYDVMHANFFMSGFAALQVKKVTSHSARHDVSRARKSAAPAPGSADGFPDERFGIEEALGINPIASSLNVRRIATTSSICMAVIAGASRPSVRVRCRRIFSDR
jgi:hypothetical protein